MASPDNNIINDEEEPKIGKQEFDFYYRAKYGAEFPWEEVEPIPTDTMITATESHAGSPNNPSKNIGLGISTVYDTVTIINLGVGYNYRLAVLARDRMTGDYAGDGGAIEFQATAPTMTLDVGLPIDASGREGHKLVLFAFLWVQGQDIPICTHEEELDEHEFIYIGSIDPEEEEEEEEPDYSGMAVDESFNNLGPIENFNSLIWTDRYSKCGDFEIYTTVDMKLFNVLGVDSYLMIPESDRYMIVEKVEIISNTSEGNKMCISGRSLESILDRRIIWHRTVIDEELEGGNTVENAIRKIITDNIIDPPNLEYRRKIPNFIFRECATDISDLKLVGEYMGDSIYDVVCNICENYNLGFRITIERNSEGKACFVFQLYQGVNRSFDSADKQYNHVIFSPEMGNMVDCNFVKNKENYKNVCRVGGETTGDDEDDQVFGSWGSDKHDGISRRELYLSASELTKKVIDNQGRKKKLSDSEYESMLDQRGHEELAEYKSALSIDGTMDVSKLKYGNTLTVGDFGLGDIIECEDLYSNHAKARITEVIITKNSSGKTIYPTFEAVTSEDLAISIIYATAETFADDTPQPLIQNKLNTEYFTYDPETCRYTCEKECTIDINWSWKCKDEPKTKNRSLMRIRVNDLIDPDGCYHYWEVTQGTSGHKGFDNMHCVVGAQFWFQKEEHGNAYVDEFHASLHVDDPT